MEGSDAHPRGGSPSKQGGHTGVRVFRIGLMRKPRLLCSGAGCGSSLGVTSSRAGDAPSGKERNSLSTWQAAREEKAKNVASTMGFGCGR
jgi:hypothetical protein